MKLTLENRGNRILGYDSGTIRVGNQHLAGPCLINAQSIHAWSATWPLTHTQLEVIFSLEPEIVILGLPAGSDLPDASIYAEFLSRRIGFEVMDVGAACRTYNILLSEDRRVAAALFPTSN